MPSPTTYTKLGEWSAETNTPTLPTIPTLAAGEFWHCIAEGDFLGIHFRNGDCIYAVDGSYQIFKPTEPEVQIQAIVVEPAAHTHPASAISEDAQHRFVTDTEKAAWNAGGATVTTVTLTDATYAVTQTSGQLRLLCNTDSTPITINLPTAAGNTCEVVVKKMASAYAVTVDAFGAELIDGAATAVLNRQYESITLVSNGTYWAII